MNVPLLDLKAQYSTIRSAVEESVARVFASQQFILGPEVEKCEAAVADYCDAGHAVGVSSGTDALLLCLMAEDVKAGDEVITTPYTFFATAGAIARVGAKPVFVDINPQTYNIDPAQIANKITPRTKAIMPVHLYGQMCEMEAIRELARAHRITVIEDAAQAIGAEYRGHRAGSIGEYGCFSFFPSKNLGAAGDAGMIVTNDTARAEMLRVLRNHGAHPKYVHKFIGGNFRLDALQAAVISVKLPHLDDWTAARRSNAERYGRLFNAAALPVTLPVIATQRHIFNQYVIRVPERDRLKKFLEQKGIGTEIYYPVPMHLQECFAYLSQPAGMFPESERAARETLAIPVYPELTDAQAEYVVSSIDAFYRSRGA